jgi:hypothetical protein
LELKYGTLALKELGVLLPQNFQQNTFTATLQGANIPCRIQQTGDTISIVFPDTLNIKAGESLIVNIG